MNRAAFLVPCASLFVSILAAQTVPRVSEVLEVRITTVGVAVSDGTGQPVRGLEREDFELFEEGVRQEIVHFAEAGRPGSAGDERRMVVFYFDQAGLSPFLRGPLVESAKRFLEASLREGDSMMVASWNGSLTVRQPWTTQRSAVVASLDGLARESGMAAAREAERKLAMSQIEAMRQDEVMGQRTGGQSRGTTFDMVMAAARRYAESARADVIRSCDDLAKLMASLSGVRGRKILVYVTESLPTRPGEELFQHIESVRQSAMADSRSAIGRSARGIQPLTEAGKYDVSKVIVALGRAANAAGVTLYAVNPRPADRSRGDSGTVEQTRGSDQAVDFAAAMQGMAGLELLAGVTGGAASVGAAPEAAFAPLAADLSGGYELAYRARPGAKGERAIEVRTRQGHRVRARTTVFYRSVPEEMAEQVIAHQLRAPLSNDLAIALAASDPPKRDGRRLLQPVRILIPVNRLTLVTRGASITGGFSVFVCSGDGKGESSGVNVQSHAIEWPAEALPHLQAKTMTFVVDVPLEEGRPQLSVGVVDHVSQATGFALAALPQVR